MTLVAQSLPHATARPQGAAVADKSIGIDALRGLAALLVAYMHARQTNWIGASTYFAGGGEGWSAGTLIAALTMPATFGAAGVSIFFVISGYVIHRSQAERAAATGTYGLHARNFLWRRFVRIYSVLTVAMLMTAALDSYGRALAPALYARFDDGFLAFVLNQLTLQGIASAPFGSNHPLWSLSVEMHFYLLYPLLLVAMQRFGAAVVFAVIVASNVVSWAMFEQREYVVFTSYYAIWCAGAYLAEWRARETAGAQQLGRRVAWAALILAGGAGCLASVARMNFVAFQLWGVAAVGLVALVLATPRSLGPVARFAAAFGAFSYSLYACHAPIVIAMNALIFEGRQEEHLADGLDFRCDGGRGGSCLCVGRASHTELSGIRTHFRKSGSDVIWKAEVFSMEEVARVDEISDQRRINPARGRWYWLVAGGVAAVALFSLLQAGLRRIMPETYVQVRGYAEGRNSLVGPYDMLVVGDSIAAGGRWATLFAGQTVGNYGRNGDKTTDLLGRLPAFRDTSAGRIYILIGTNDVLQGRPTAQIVDDYRAVVRALHRDGREIMLNSILPPESALLRQHWGIVFDGRALRELNNELKRMAVGEGARYVDLINALAPAGQLSPEMTSDGVHLTPRGYAAIAGVWSALTVEGAR